MLDKNRIMQVNSIKNPNDDYVIYGPYLLSHREANNRVTLEFFDFQTKMKYVVFKTDNASEVLPEIWSHNGFSRMEYVRGCITYTLENGSQFKV